MIWVMKCRDSRQFSCPRFSIYLSLIHIYLVDAFNAFWADEVANGTALEVATTYGLQDAVILE